MSTMIPGIPDMMSGIKSALGIGEEAKARKSEKNEVRRWFKRISLARDDKKKWEESYEVERSHDYVRGFQRPREDNIDAQSDKRYQINKILAAMKSKIPTIFYYHPYIRIRPQRGREDTPGGTIHQRAELLQDTINTIIKLKDTRFKPECMSALKEAQWAFGLVEAGYEADWSENPFARKPAPFIESDAVEDEMKQDQNLIGDASEEEQLLAGLGGEDGLVPHHESFYVKHIPARQFLVSSNDRSATERMDWVGYWEWMYVKDVQRTEGFANTGDLKPTAKLTGGPGSTDGYDRELAPMHDDDSPDATPADMIRIWKIWDQREMVRYVLAEGHDHILKEDEFDHLPLFPLRLETMPGEWYPIPPIFQQLTEQDEYNDAREWVRNMRKGTRPRFMFDKGAFTQSELEKLESDEFGTFIGVDNANMGAIVPIPQPFMGEAAIRTLGYAEAGFAEQAASSPTARLTRGEGGAPTATEVDALGQAGDVRSSYEQQDVADWMSAIAGGILLTAIESMTLPQWVLINSDPYAAGLMEDTMQIENTLEMIKKPLPDQVAEIVMMLEQQLSPKAPQDRRELTPEDLEEAYGAGKWDVTVDIESMSPVTESQHASRIMQALNMIASEGPGELLALSPELLKSMLNMMGIRSAQDQQNIMGALQKKQMMNQLMQMMEQMQAGQQGSPPAKKGVAPTGGGDQPNSGAGGGAPPPSVQAAMGG
ncbi:MAG: hypothetical protein JRE40_12315 [Deltaproteobacteria bacterium]|nr:hypothetical protein [Deltaproteobacteria bacterium]